MTEQGTGAHIAEQTGYSPPLQPFHPSRLLVNPLKIKACIDDRSLNQITIKSN